ncbi:AbiV family abortive infection protein [Candidatus Bathyarchaeota archaeon]|nr:AbiV family abortive infection protein [Candidatus Bathyarchaeota archaeon]
MLEQNLLAIASKCCLDNAKQYIKDAQLLCSNKSYGHAIALTVLSDVELGKSVIYHISAKGIISENALPPQFSSYFKEKQFDKLASETWWVGLVLASKLEVIVPSLITLCEYSGNITINKQTTKLSPEANKTISEIIERIKPENNKIKELIDFLDKEFFVKFNLEEMKVDCPLKTKESFVKKRLKKDSERIENGEPFLSLSFSEIQIKIARLLLKGAFESILPMRKKIKQLIIPLESK